MFVFSVKADRKKLLWVVCGAVILAVLIVVLAASRGRAVQTAAGYQLQARDNAQRRAFLAQFGWEVSEEPTEICEVIIPDTFDSVYQQYNELQRSQEFDLMRYQGRRVKRWTYEVKNYPDYEGTVVANLLICNDTVIGGDIASNALNGFMQGFRRNSEPIRLPPESVPSAESGAVSAAESAAAPASSDAAALSSG
ncbi:MAG: DUF4830 domain-containing protein [Firmicutes bacterium]|nr:DUF4830 domain-containing protein [Bacillota bacterium]